MLNYFRKKKQEKMNKIVDEVVSQIEVRMEDLFDNFVSRLNGQEIDYYELSQNIQYDDLGQHIDNEEVAGYVSIESEDVAYHMDEADIASCVEHEDIAQHLDASEVAQFVEFDFDDLKSEIFDEVRNMIEDAVDEVESSIDQLTISRA